MSRTRRALSPMASPRCAAGTHWLMIIGPGVPGSVAARQGAIQRRAVLAELLQPFELVELRPEIERHLGRRARRRVRGPGRRSASSVPAKSFAASRSSAASCDSTIACSSAASLRIGVHDLGDLRRILGVVEHAAAVHRRRHRGRGVGEHRHALVERLDDRHAEAFVLAGAQEQIGDVVERRQLLVRHVAEEVHVRRAEPRDQRGAAARGTSRSRCTSRPAAAGRADCGGCDRRGTRGSRPRTSCSGSPGRRTSRWSTSSSNPPASARSGGDVEMGEVRARPAARRSPGIRAPRARAGCTPSRRAPARSDRCRR